MFQKSTLLLHPSRRSRGLFNHHFILDYIILCCCYHILSLFLFKPFFAEELIYAALSTILVLILFSLNTERHIGNTWLFVEPVTSKGCTLLGILPIAYCKKSPLTSIDVTRKSRKKAKTRFVPPSIFHSRLRFRVSVPCKRHC